MCRPEFGNGELRERPLTENGDRVGFQSGLSLKNEGGFGTKNNKETYTFKSGVFWSSPCRKSGTNKCIFLEREVFRCGPGRKRGVFRSGSGRKMGGFRAAHTRTALIWEYPPTHTHTHTGQTNGGLSGGTYPYCPNMGVPPPPHTHTRTHTGQTKTKEKSLINDLCLTDRQTHTHTDRKERKTKEKSLINVLCLTDRQTGTQTEKKEKRRKTH